MENVDWAALPFNYHKTDYNVRISYKDGKWGEPELTQDEYISVHMSAPCLHYGVESFEGLKAFRGADGKVRLFRPDENGKRFAATARKLCMAELPVETFVEMCRMVVKANERFVPPYGTGATLYLRPLEIGMGAFLGVHPAKEFMVCVFVSPVGAYFKEGIKPIRVIVNPDYDRAAPHGTGAAKVGGNYAASMLPGKIAHDSNFSDVIYLDPATHTKIEEVGSANFFGITADNEFITPLSPSILPSITKFSLLYLAENRFGMKAIQGDVKISELDKFVEAGACGTAAVISPIGGVQHGDDFHVFYSETEVGPVTRKLYDELTGIQFGDVEAPEGWIVKVD